MYIKINKNMCLLLTIASLFVCLLFVQDAYAKYISTADASTNIDIARWKINVNNVDITENSNLNSLITPIFEGSEHIAENIVAPEATGYFDIVIDPSNTDVSFNYKVTTSKADSSCVNDLITTGYSVNNGEIINSDRVPIKGSIVKNTTEVTTLRIYVKWIDQVASETMNNSNDTQAATTSNCNANLNVNLMFTQVSENN